MKVIFVHPSYPNQFTRIAHGLGKREGWECAFLVNEGFTEQVRRENPPIAYYGFREEVSPPSGSFYIQSLEEGARRGKTVVEALAYLKASVGLDMVVGHAAFGTTFFIREILKVPEVIAHGQEGLLFDPLDVEGFSRAALDILGSQVGFDISGLTPGKRSLANFPLKMRKMGTRQS